MVDKEQGWLSARLEELLIHVIGGDWGKGDDYVDDDFETVSCIRGSEFKNWKTELGATAVTRRVKSSSLVTRQLVDGDLLIEISGGGPDQPVGRTVLITEQVLGRLSYPAVCTNFLRLARPSNYFNSAFLNHYLAKFYNSGEVVNYQGGSNNLRNLKFKEYSKIEIPIPPLAEQKVIADKLDTLLAQVETTKARLERIPEILKTFRQSVLAAAVSGKLTENWRGNANYMANKVTFGKLILSSSVGLVRSASDQHEDANGRYAYVKMNNIDNFWGHNIDNLKFVNASAEEISKYSLEKGDWLFNTRNSSELVGKSCVWQGKDGLLYNNNILRVKFKDSVLPEFIEIFIKSPKGQQLLNSIKSGTTNVAAIYQKQLFQLTIDMPSLYEQAEIVRRVQELFTVADRVEEKAKPALKGVNQLTQSILAKAFRGELTADWRAANQELITGQNSTETLLEKIKEERQKLKPTRKARTKK